MELGRDRDHPERGESAAPGREMPTRPFNAQELGESQLALTAAMLLGMRRRRRQASLRRQGRHSEAQRHSRLNEVAMLAFAAEPLLRSTRSRIGPERLSLARLERETAEAGGGNGIVVRDVYARFGVRLEDLPRFIAS